jgi:N-acetylglucosamine-6-phosphate deacetylase
VKGSHGTSALLCNVRAVLPQRTIERASLLIQDGFVSRILESPVTELPPAKSILDLKNLTLFPSFIDVHIHGAIGVDTMAASADDLWRVSKFLAAHGIAGWLPTLVPAPHENYERAVRAIEELMDRQRDGQRSLEGARVLGVHYEGPFVSAAQCGALHSDYFKSFSHLSDLDVLPIPKDRRAARMMTLAPEVEGGVELVRELTNRGWIVSIGHTRATVEVLDRACEAGARHMTHFMNAMAPLHHRSPGPIAWGLARDDVTCDVIADGIHLDPYMLRLILRFKTPHRLALISDAIAAAGMGDGEYKIWGETIEVKNGRTSNSQGNIAGSAISMLDAVRMMTSLEVSEIEIAQMAATNPARLLRIDHDCGSIEEGKRADLVALDEQRNVRLTIIGGRVAFQMQNPPKTNR